jgi:hypothetical protein
MAPVFYTVKVSNNFLSTQAAKGTARNHKRVEKKFSKKFLQIKTSSTSLTFLKNKNLKMLYLIQ